MNKYVFEITKDSLLDDKAIRQSLPDHFEFIKEGLDYFMKINIDDVKTEEQAYYFVQRECDRIHFLTGLEIHCQYRYIEGSNKQLFYASSPPVTDILYGLLPADIKPQRWSNRLAMQLSLWQLATNETIQVSTRICLFFQIIELVKPETEQDNHYPEYTDSTLAPEKITECKLLRNLLVRPINRDDPQLQNYYRYLGYRTSLPDLADDEFLRILKTKLPLLRAEAKRFIKATLNSD